MEDKYFPKSWLLVLDNQHGFTLIELAMALTMSAIVLIGLSVLVSGSYEYLQEGTNKINLQQDYSFIEIILSTNIKQSLYSNHEIYDSYSDFMSGQPTQSSGSCLKLEFPSFDWMVFYKDSLDFKIMKSDSTTTNLVPGVVSNLTFSTQTNAIQTDLYLIKNQWTVGGTFIHVFRN